MSELPVRVTVGLVDEISQKLDRIKNKFPELQKAVGRVKNNFDYVQESTKSFRKSAEDLATNIGKPMQKIGSSMTKFVTLPVAAGAAYSVKKFMDFEKALVEVGGSTNLTGVELEDFGKKITKLSSKTTFSQDELLGLANAAGEAGVRGSSNLEQFSITMAKLGKTAKGILPDTSLQLKKILDLTGEGDEKIGNFGSAITTAENVFKVQAGRIIDSSQAIGREVAKFGLSSTQVLGFATAIEPMGFEAKQASMAVGEGFRGIDDAIREGGIKMQGLQKITGMTGEQLKETFQKDPQAVFNAFLSGLKKIDAAGGETSKALDFFGASGDKTQVILTSLAKESDKLSNIQETLKNSFNDNTALNKEYEEASKTLSDSLSKLHNGISALAVTLGARLAPVISAVASGLSKLVDFFNEHPTIATFAASVALVLAVVGPMLWLLGSFLVVLPKILIAINFLTAAFAVFKAILIAVGIALGIGVGWVLVIGVAIVALGAILWSFRDIIWDSMVVAWDWVIDRIKKAIDLMKTATAFLSQGLMKYTPLGALAFGANKALNAIAPSAPEQNLSQTAKSANSEFETRTNNAHVFVDVRAPAGTGVRSESQNGTMTLNRGMVGVL